MKYYIHSERGKEEAYPLQKDHQRAPLENRKKYDPKIRFGYLKATFSNILR